MYYVNDKEEEIIGSFMNIEDELEGTEVMLIWNNGSCVQGIYDSFIEDESDCEMEDEKYEEFWSFVFKLVNFSGEPPVFITKDNFFCVNYHNFPDAIMVEGKKIN